MSDKEQRVRRMAEKLQGEAQGSPWWAGVTAAQEDPCPHLSDGALLLLMAEAEVPRIAQELVAADRAQATALAAAILEVLAGETPPAGAA